MTGDDSRWAEALAIERQHGTDAPRWIAERIGALALEGNQAGVLRFRTIAARLSQLRAGKEPQCSIENEPKPHTRTLQL